MLHRARILPWDRCDRTGQAKAGHEAPDADPEALIRDIQQSRGIDVRGCRKTSLRRRIHRRMEEAGTRGFAACHAFLAAHPGEPVGLPNTVLVNVSCFFRDAEAWEALRIWSLGCASGEEPYSLAIAFAEAMGPEAFARRV